MAANSDARLRYLSAVFLIAASLLTAKLFFLQIIRGEDYKTQADRQYERPAGLTFNRGNIYFTSRDGKEVSAATLQTGYLLAINPIKLKDSETVYSALNAVYPLDYANFIARASKNNDPHEEIGSRLTADQAKAISALNLTGVELIEQKWRFYPGGTLAAHVLGFMGYQGNDYSGRYGLEKYYDRLLRREEPLSFSSFLGRIFLGLAEPSSSTNQPGDVVTTIEPTAQRFLEHELEAIQTAWNPSLTGGIIMDPKTGAIISLAALPTFDPGEKQSDVKHLINPLVERVYEMGSIVKPLTMGAGLDAKVVTPTTTYDDQGVITFGDREIGNYDRRGRGVASMQEVLNQSLNTGAVYVMQQLGGDRFVKYFQDFGLLGEKTGVDLPGESGGLADNLKSRRAVEYATASFGQGLANTPLAITVALSALANGGALVRPFVTKKIVYETKLTEETKPIIRRQVISPEAASTTTAMLVQVVDKALGGQKRLPRYQVAAKTGTAQIRQPGGGYYSDRYLHSFFGYFPASNPRFAIFLYAIAPQGAEYASATLTKPFFNITKFLLNYYQIPPDR